MKEGLFHVTRQGSPCISARRRSVPSISPELASEAGSYTNKSSVGVGAAVPAQVQIILNMAASSFLSVF